MPGAEPSDSGYSIAWIAGSNAANYTFYTYNTVRDTGNTDTGANDEAYTCANTIYTKADAYTDTEADAAVYRH